MSATIHRAPVRMPADKVAEEMRDRLGSPVPRHDHATTQQDLETDRTNISSEKPREFSYAALLCPKCRKRLPFSKEICMCGTVSVFCRFCGRTIELTIRIVEE